MEAKERGNVHFQAHRYEEAADAYSVGLQQKELPPLLRAQLQSNRAASLGKLCRWQEVITACTSALEAAPDYPKALWRRREAYEAIEDYARALSDAVRYNKIEPTAETARRCQVLRDLVGSRRDVDRSMLFPQNILKALDEPDVLQALTTLEQSRNRYPKEVIVKAGAIEKVATVLLSNDGNEVATAGLSFLWRICTAEQDASIAWATPVPVDEWTMLARDCLRGSLDPNDLTPFLTNPHLCNNAAKVLCYLGDVDSDTCLEKLTLGIDAVEAGVCDGVQVLSQWCDSRRRLGKSVKAFVPKHSFHKAMEACLRQTDCSTVLQGLCAQAWTLITDSDRGSDEKIDPAQIALQYLEPFWTSTDANYRANGLMALAVLFHVNYKIGTSVLQGRGGAFHCIVNACMAHDHVDHNEQLWGADMLMYSMRDIATRNSFLESGGLDILTNLLDEVSQWDNTSSKRGLQAQVLKAKVVAVLGTLASHSENTRKDVFYAVDFMALLGVAIGFIRNMDGEERRRHAKALLEGIVMLSVHSSFKEMLVCSETMDVLKKGLVRAEDLQTDTQLAFLYVCLLQNLLRSRENKTRQKKKEYPFNEMTDQEADAMEEFYEKMPAESRPVKNGIVDMGPPELAEKCREVFCCKESIESLNVIAFHGSSSGQRMVAECFKLFCENVQRRQQVVAHGGVRSLLKIYDVADDSGDVGDAARQALAQICIVTNPKMFSYSDAMDMISPLISLFRHSHELLQFEGALAITNLASIPTYREKIVSADGWAGLKQLIFSDDFRLQRAGLEGMCNLCLDDTVVEAFAIGKRETELKLFLSFSTLATEDEQTLVAATGALAILAHVPEIATQILAQENFSNLLQLLGESLSPSIEHRVISLLACLSEVESPLNNRGVIRSALHLKAQHGCVSAEAQEILNELK